MTGAEWIFIGFAFACSFLFNRPVKKEEQPSEAKKFADLIKHYLEKGIPVQIKSPDDD
jgi:hypothetical protein